MAAMEGAARAQPRDKRTVHESTILMGPIQFAATRSEVHQPWRGRTSVRSADAQNMNSGGPACRGLGKHTGAGQGPEDQPLLSLYRQLVGPAPDPMRHAHLRGGSP